jgi:hypothetical protein
MSYTAKMALSVAEVYTRRADELHESALHDEVENDADGIAYYQRSAIICLLSILVGEIDEVSRLHDH